MKNTLGRASPMRASVWEVLADRNSGGGLENQQDFSPPQADGVWLRFIRIRSPYTPYSSYLRGTIGSWVSCMSMVQGTSIRPQMIPVVYVRLLNYIRLRLGLIKKGSHGSLCNVLRLGHSPLP